MCWLCSPSRESLSWTGRTVLPSGQSVSFLNVLANDSSSSREERARAIFTLFAHHIRPGSSAAEVHAVLTSTNWMASANLYAVTALGGWVPVEYTLEDSVFCMDASPADMDKQWSPWIICLRLSGIKPSGRNQEELIREALAFLSGDTRLHGNPKLVEFALCFPGQPEVGRRHIERFCRRGTHVYDW